MIRRIKHASRKEGCGETRALSVHLSRAPRINFLRVHRCNNYASSLIRNEAIQLRREWYVASRGTGIIYNLESRVRGDAFCCNDNRKQVTRAPPDAILMAEWPGSTSGQRMRLSSAPIIRLLGFTRIPSVKELLLSYSRRGNKLPRCRLCFERLPQPRA